MKRLFLCFLKSLPYFYQNCLWSTLSNGILLVITTNEWTWTFLIWHSILCQHQQFFLKIFSISPNSIKMQMEKKFSVSTNFSLFWIANIFFFLLIFYCLVFCILICEICGFVMYVYIFFIIFYLSASFILEFYYVSLHIKKSCDYEMNWGYLSLGTWLV